MSLPVLLEWIGCAPLTVGFWLLCGALDSGGPLEGAWGAFSMVVGGGILVWAEHLRDLRS